MQRCVARAVLQPHPLLDGVTRDWSIKLGMLAELPLFDARGARTAVQDAEHNVAEVCSEPLLKHIYSDLCIATVHVV